MSIEILSELENKVDQLLLAFNAKKAHIETLNEEITSKNNLISEIEAQNVSLKRELEELSSSSNDRQQKLDHTAEKIQEMIKKLDVAS